MVLQYVLTSLILSYSTSVLSFSDFNYQKEGKKAPGISEHEIKGEACLHAFFKTGVIYVTVHGASTISGIVGVYDLKGNTIVQEQAYDQENPSDLHTLEIPQLDELNLKVVLVSEEQILEAHVSCVNSNL